MPIGWSSWRDLEKCGAFEAVGAWMPNDQIIGPDRVRVAGGVLVSAGLLDMVGAKASRGRLFSEEDDEQPNDVVIVTDAFWRSSLGARSDVIGSDLLLAPTPLSPLERKTVVGVLSANSSFPGMSPDIYLPIGLMAFNGSFEQNRFLQVVGRLGVGITPEQAFAVAEPLVRRTFSATERSARVVRLREELIGEDGGPISMFGLAAFLVLAITSVNLSALYLGRLSSLRHEMALRVALGASRWNLSRRLIGEVSLVTGLSALIGGAIGALVTRAIWSLAPVPPGINAPGANWHVVLVAVGASAGSALVVTLPLVWVRFPVLQMSALSVAQMGSSPRGARGQRFMMTLQVAISLVLVVAACLMAATFVSLSQRPLGFSVDDVVVASLRYTEVPSVPSNLSMLQETGLSPNRQAAMQPLMAAWSHLTDLADRVRALPGVTHAAIARAAPLARTLPSAGVRADGSDSTDVISVGWLPVSEDYFDALRLPLLAGRRFTSPDRNRSDTVVVSQELAARLFAGAAVGRTLWRGAIAHTVVGVVGNAKQLGLRDEDLMIVYDLNRGFVWSFDFLVRSDDPNMALTSLRSVITTFDSHLVVESVEPLEARAKRAATPERFRATLSIGLAALTILLVAVGSFGVADRYVAERRHEIGIRMALGASHHNVRALVSRDGLKAVAFGTAVGLPLAAIVAGSMQAMFFGVTPTAPWVLLLAVAILSASALAGMFVPAVRATRVDPLRVLKG